MGNKKESSTKLRYSVAEIREKEIKKGSRIKRRIDVISLILTIIGVLFLSLFIKETLALEWQILKQVLKVALVVVILSQINFQILLARWLKRNFRKQRHMSMIWEADQPEIT